ncbi:MAG: aminotransferase class V-fold PLP-dependent enzyme, partial [Prevotella sp.]
MINIQQSFTPDPGFGYIQSPPTDGGALERLKALASQYCPEGYQAERQAILPDEELHLEELEAGFKALLSGGSPFPDLPYIGDGQPQYDAAAPHPESEAPHAPSANIEDGFGIGIPESQKLQNLHYDEVDTLNSEEIKKDFPVLQQKVNGHDLVWLDNGATTQKPIQVIDKISDYYKTYNSNIHRGAHTLAARATDAYEEAREKVQRFINAATSEEIIFVRGTTEGINLVAQTYGRQFLTPGDEVIVSELDHHANIVPWQQVAHEKGATLKAIPTDKNGDLI